MTPTAGRDASGQPGDRKGLHRLTRTACAVLLLDQLTKFAVQRAFAPGESLPALPPLLSLTYVQNTGAAFGLFKGQRVLFILLAAGIAAWILREALAAPAQSRSAAWGFALVLGGSAGNLIDRLRFGYVVDFLDFHVWPVFNVADSAITVGVALLLWGALRPRRQ